MGCISILHQSPANYADGLQIHRIGGSEPVNYIKNIFPVGMRNVVGFTTRKWAG